MSKKRYMNAQEAAEALGISRATLYAYVSRGLIRSEAVDDDTRKRRYYAEDVEKLLARKEGRRNPEKLAQAALHWGTPVLESALTLIANGRLYYRGQDAAELAVTHSIEAVAALLWTGDSAQAEELFTPGKLPDMPPQVATLAPLERFQVMLPLAAADDLTAYDLRPAAVMRTGARILRLLLGIAAGTTANTGAETLRRGWCPDDPDATGLLNAALVLCADHELNASSFTARVVASAGSPPYAVVSAGLAALQGAKHGGHTERVEAFLREAGNAAGVRAALAGRLKRGESIPGFGHRLYPDGDPRAQVLLRLIERHAPASPALELARTVLEAVERHIGEKPTIDFGLATVGRVLDLPPGGALALFALGRSTGWIGHALEAYAEGRLIRPRAKYVGEQPR